MNRLSDALQKEEDYAGGEAPASVTEERKQQTHGRRNGEDEDLRIMQHFVQGHVPGPTLLLWRMKIPG